MYHNTGLGNIYKGDFPNGSLRRDFHAITGQMKDRSGRNSWVYIAAMSDERARKVIKQICDLSTDVSCALGGQKVELAGRVDRDRVVISNPPHETRYPTPIETCGGNSKLGRFCTLKST